jgi:hypothetical protein
LYSEFLGQITCRLPDYAEASLVNKSIFNT